MKLFGQLLSLFFLYPLIISSVDLAKNETTRKLIHALESPKKLYKIKSLLKAGADSNAKNHLGESVLMVLTKHCKYFDSEFLDYLLTTGFDINAENNIGENILMYFLQWPGSHSVRFNQHEIYFQRSRIIKKIIAAGINVNKATHTGNTALMHAIRYPKLVKHLLAAGANVNATNAEGETVLHYAFKELGNIYTFEHYHNFKKVIRFLLDAHADLNAKTYNGSTVIMYAAHYYHNSVMKVDDDYNLIKLLVDHGAQVNETDNNGTTALMIAAQNASVYNADIIQPLIQTGADRTLYNNQGLTALKIAAQYNPSAVQIFLAFSDIENSLDSLINILSEDYKDLIEQHGVINIKNEGINQLMAAVRWNPQLVPSLIPICKDINERSENEDGWTALMFAARYNASVITMLIQAGADIELGEYDYSGDGGDTPLLIASRWNADAVGPLLLAGSNIKVKTRLPDGVERDALKMAVDFNQKAIEPILNAWTKVDAHCEEGSQALCVAVKHKTNYVELLLKAGADASKALLVAAKKSTPDIIKSLIKAGAQIEQKDFYDKTPLFYAVAAGKLDNVETLLSLGALSNHQDYYDCTPLMEAVFWGSDAIVEKLVMAGSDTSLKNKNGETAFMIAAKNKNMSCLKIVENCSSLKQSQMHS